ncbi:alpha/beta hydrolase [Nocardioides sp.]|uniref:alpha/beta fold hydrolase n=1 Tax=Nocardioides sp. TaxID=35761 RepID=UPI0031FE710F|nr:Pimeloyl-ACP methyl ester carboxylesterase [Nocardioides sp.]
MTHQTINLPAGTIHYREAGPDTGAAVVFVHGFLVDDTLWSDVPERLAGQGFHAFAPTWPLASHRTAMEPGTDLSPRGVARVILSFLEAKDLRDVTLVGNDTGGAVCQFLLDEDSSRIGRLVLTNCDAFDTFPPFPFDLLFRMAKHPRTTRTVLQVMRSTFLRNSKLGFGWLVKRKLTAEESRAWVTPYLTDEGVRRDVATFARGAHAKDLADVATRLPGFEKPVLLCWAPADPFFKIALGRRLEATFPNARLVEVPDALTFVALDQPERLAREIAAFAG